MAKKWEMGKKKGRTGPIPTGQTTCLQFKSFSFFLLQHGFSVLTTQVLTILPTFQTYWAESWTPEGAAHSTALMGQSLFPTQRWCAARSTILGSWSVITLQLYQALPSGLCSGPHTHEYTRQLPSEDSVGWLNSMALLSLGLDALWNILWHLHAYNHAPTTLVFCRIGNIRCHPSLLLMSLRVVAPAISIAPGFSGTTPGVSVRHYTRL